MFAGRLRGLGDFLDTFYVSKKREAPDMSDLVSTKIPNFSAKLWRKQIGALKFGLVSYC